MTQPIYVQDFNKQRRYGHRHLAYKIFRDHPNLVDYLSKNGIIDTFRDFHKDNMFDEAREFLEAIRRSDNKKAADLIEFVNTIYETIEIRR